MEGAFLEPNNLDDVATGVLTGKHIGEVMTGTWWTGGPNTPAGQSGSPNSGSALSDVDVIVK